MQYSIENDILRLTVDSHGAESVILGHLADLPDGTVVIHRDAVGAGVAGIGVCGDAAVDQQSQYNVSDDAQSDKDAHGCQQPGGAALGRGVAVDVVWHMKMFSLFVWAGGSCRILYSITQRRTKL